MATGRRGLHRPARMVIAFALVVGVLAIPAQAGPAQAGSSQAGSAQAGPEQNASAGRQQVAECADVHPEVPPPGVEGQLTAVDAGDDGSAWAVGFSVSDDGTRKPVALQWTGTEWRDHSTDLVGNAYIELLGVTALSARDVWVVGRWVVLGRSFPHIEHWDGTRWTAYDGTDGKSVGEPTDRSLLRRLLELVYELLRWLLGLGHGHGRDQGFGSRQGQLTAVTAFSPDDVWAVGWTTRAVRKDSEVLLSNRTGGYAGRVPLVWRYDGTRWAPTPDRLPPSRDAALSGIAGYGPDDLWVVGERSNGSRGTDPLIFHRAGNTWTDESADGAGERDVLKGVVASPRGPLAGGYSTGDAAGYSTSHGTGGGEGRPLLQRRGLDGRWAVEAVDAVEEPGMLSGVASTPAADWAVGVTMPGGSDPVPLLLRRTDAEQWDPVPDRLLEADRSGWLNAIATLPAGGGWAVGTSYQKPDDESPAVAKRGKKRGDKHGPELVPLIVRLCGADLALTGEASPPGLRVGEPVTYTLLVYNGGPHYLGSATVTATVPPEVRVTAARSCTPQDDEARRLRCDVRSLRAGGTKQLTIKGLAERTGEDVTLAASIRPEIINDANRANNTVRVLLDVVAGVPCDRVWRAVPSAPDATLGALAGVGAGRDGSVWAVGRRYDRDGKDYLLRPSAQRWNGTRWKSADVELPPGREGELRGVVLGGDEAWAVGLEHGDGARSRPLLVHWDGSTWRPVQVPGQPSGRLNAVAAFSPTEVWAVGAVTDAAGRAVAPLVLRRSGGRWATVQGLPAGGGYVELFGLTGQGRDRWVVGGEGRRTPAGGRSLAAASGGSAPPGGTATYVARFDGTRWTREASQSFAGAAGQALRGVTIAPGGPLAVGYAGGQGFAERRRVRPGAAPTWTVEGQVAAQLFGVAATQYGAWAVGGVKGSLNAPVLRRWVRGTWSTGQAPALDPEVSAAFAGVAVSSSGDTWAVGYVGQTPLIARLCGANLRVTAEAEPTPAIVGAGLTYTVTVTNGGAHPAPATRLSAAPDRSMRIESVTARLGEGGPPSPDACRSAGPGRRTVTCALGALGSGESATVLLTAVPGRAGERVPFTADVASALEDPFPADNTARLGVEVLAPTVRTEPQVGTPGFVTMVGGADFPPNAEVTLTWDQGLGTATVTAGEDGAFVGWMLIFTNDQIGPRKLEARFDGGPQQPPTADFLVVPRSQQPQKFLDRS
ncbi:MAG: DUF11 domain-containing protein [Streptosporangiales bacterium]|nr:DUF11 domain-containing protein [Streptosporangiales bacterium]